MLQFGLANDHFKAIHVQLAIIQSTLCAYNASSQLISSVNLSYICRELERKEGYVSRNGKFISA